MTLDQIIRRLYGDSAPRHCWFRPATFVIQVMKDHLGTPDHMVVQQKRLELGWNADDGRILFRGAQGVIGGEPALLNCEVQVFRTMNQIT